MKSRMIDTVRHLAVALGVTSSPAWAADVASAATAGTDDSTGFLMDFLTLESILPVGVVVLALVVIARKRNVH